MSLEQLAADVRSGRRSATDLVAQALERIQRLNPPLNAFSAIAEDAAMADAETIDRRIADGEDVGPLAGIPFGVKDLEDVTGMPTGRGSRWFDDAAPATRSDIHVERLIAAGAIPIGKTTTPEFGAAAITANLVTGVTRNPWDATKTPGGSSGGSAAAVAAGMLPFCTASDGGGSIRTPAAFTGLPGLRPTYGRIPSYGSTHVAQNAVNFALATSVRDTALLLDVCAGPHPMDRTCLPAPETPFTMRLDSLPTAGLRVAYTSSYGTGEVDHEVDQLVRDGVSNLSRLAGLDVVDIPVELPDFFDTYTKIEGVDRWIDLPPGLWPERAGELGDHLQAGWASGARARLTQLGQVYTDRRRLEHHVAGVFTNLDLLVTPSTGVAAFDAEGPVPSEINGVSVAPFQALIQPIMPSLCNLPAISVPVGLTSTGLPVGMQIIARRFREDLCLRLAHIYETVVGWPMLTS